MHGTILSELQNFITAKFGLAFRNQIQHAAGVGPRIYMPIITYPDAEAVALVQAAAQLSGRSAPELLTAFGFTGSRACESPARRLRGSSAPASAARKC